MVGRRWSPWVALCVAALVASCASTPAYDFAPTPEPDAAWDTDRHSVPTPAWARMPLSWSKLGAIETWLKSPDARTSGFWWTEAMVTLNEGRVEFARRDHEESADPNALKQRLWAARQGFQTVLQGKRASDTQEHRAQRALARIAELEKFDAKGGITRLDHGIVRRSEWGARAAKPSNLTPSHDKFTRITIHHSADALTPNLDGSKASSASALRRLQKVHMEKEDPYADIGYHFLIDPQGRVFQGRELKWQGAHAFRSNNVQNLGICLLGNFESHRPTPQAMKALERTVSDMRRRYGIPRTQLYGHQDFRNTKCPGERLMSWVRDYRGRR